ncbi:MAG: hypothetical protein R3D02_07590 [Hyphomicrobiales bacterium]
MHWTIEFAPLLPVWLLAITALLLLAVAAVVLWRRMRGGPLRLAAGALLLAALANPSFVSEDRRPLDGVVAVVVDESPSQKLADRAGQTATALAALRERLARFRGLEVRVVEAGRADGVTDGTHLFGALATALGDVPPDRVAGAVLITDGEVHDVPEKAGALGFAAPLHVLLTGRPGERDRRLELVAAPRFGLVGKEQTVTVRLEDRGSAPTDEPATIVLRRDGEVVDSRPARPGETLTLPVTVEHAGETIVEVEASGLDGELTPLNNRVVARIEGIREALRVLLVSGEPHPGERTWRNLLKSDASVDLVHFTILRPPSKQDGTPINELSLIAFPTRELFQEKIDEFDLIIFDRYRRRGVLPTLYFDNMARYVRDGGAILIAAGPEYASPDSLYDSPLSPVLPGAPTGEIIEAPYLPMVSAAGARHPVTRDLPGGEKSPPGWSRWFRLVDMAALGGDTVMEGPDGRPLLVLEHEGKGRVALLASDQVWLWARGYDGGGPHVDLLRRLAHWLMQEPDLEEEALRASVAAGTLRVERQTMGDSAAPVTVTTPAGETIELALAPAGPGLWRAEIPAGELGLYRAGDGERTALAHSGTPNPREFSEVISTPDRLAPLVAAAGGGIFRLAEADGSARALPRIVPIRKAAKLAGTDWMGIRQTEASVLEGIDRTPLLLGLFGVALLLGAFAATWYREGR